MNNFFSFFSFADANVRWVTAGMILLGICAAVVGCFSYLRKQSLIGDAIAHSVLPGICVAFMISGTKNPLLLIAGALVSSWLSLMAINVIITKSKIKPDAALGLTLSVFFGFGILLLTTIQHSGMAAQSGLDKFLLGKAASLLLEDVYVLAIMAVIIIGVILLLYKEFMLITFQPEFAKSIGLPVKGLETTLSILTVFAVAIGIQAVGVVLMASLLIAPAVAARFWTNSLPKMLILAAFFGAIAGVTGAYISYTAAQMPTGPWVVVTLTLITLLSALFSPKQSILAKWILQQKNYMLVIDEHILKSFYYLYETDNEPFKNRSISEIQKIYPIPVWQLQSALIRLKNKKLINNQNKMLQISELGWSESKRIVRVHRLWELYLHKFLRIKTENVHANAESIEHVITPEIERRLQEALEQPTADPHKKQIPL